MGSEKDGILKMRNQCGNTLSKEEEHNQPAGVDQLGPQKRRREISLANTVTPVSGRDWKQLDEMITRPRR